MVTFNFDQNALAFVFFGIFVCAVGFYLELEGGKIIKNRYKGSLLKGHVSPIIAIIDAFVWYIFPLLLIFFGIFLSLRGFDALQ